MLNLFRSRKLDKLFEQRRKRLYRLAVSWCHDPMLADDLVQDTLGKALQKSYQLKEVKKLDAWLFRILHNSWMEYLRKHKPAMDLDDIDPLDEATPESYVSDEQLVMRVHLAVSKLPMAQRQVISLIDLEGFSYSDVAEILDVPIGTVMSRLNRARTTLKRLLIGLSLSKQTLPSSQADYLRRVK